MCNKVVHDVGKRTVGLAFKAILTALEQDVPLHLPPHRLSILRSIQLHTLVAEQRLLHRELIPFNKQRVQLDILEYREAVWGQVQGHVLLKGRLYGLEGQASRPRCTWPRCTTSLHMAPDPVNDRPASLGRNELVQLNSMVLLMHAQQHRATATGCGR